MKYAVLVLGLLAALCTNAQNHLKDFAHKRSLKQDGLQLNFTVLDDDKRGVRHYNPSKFYFWTKAQHLRSTRGASSGDLLHGVFEAFYESKQLSHKGSFDKGLKHGTWNYWNEDGNYIRKEHWHHGKQTGKQLYYDGNGQLIRTEILRGNKKKRIQSDTVIIWKMFERKTIILKDSLGRTQEVQEYKNSLLHGTSKSYSAGKLESKTKFKNGVEVVRSKEGKDEMSTPSATTEEAKESGKLKQLWQKWFPKKEQSEKTKKEKSKREKKERKEKNNESKTEEVKG